MVRKLAVPFCLLAFAAAAAAAIVWVAPRYGGGGPDGSDPRQRTFDRMRAGGGGAVYAEDQPAGATEALVGFAVTEAAGFVAVYDDADGVPGEVIGVSGLLPAGGGEHVVVPLTRPFVEGEVYYAMLRRDDGDGSFEPDEDSPAVDSSDAVAVMSFVARATATPEDGPVEP
jgi:hypothetical protein